MEVPQRDAQFLGRHACRVLVLTEVCAGLIDLVAISHENVMRDDVAMLIIWPVVLQGTTVNHQRVFEADGGLQVAARRAGGLKLALRVSNESGLSAFVRQIKPTNNGHSIFWLHQHCPAWP